MKKGRILIVYFSRTGRCKEMAELMREETQGDIEEIKSVTNWSGKMGYIKAGFFALIKKATPIEDVKNNPSKYNEVMLVTPIWAGKMCCPVRTYLTKHAKEIKSVTLVTVAMATRSASVEKELANNYGVKISKAISMVGNDVKVNNLLS